MADDAPGGGSPVVGDFAGLGKLADSKLANKVYDDGLSPTVKETGGVVADFARAGRHVVNRLLNLGLDRFDYYMDRIESAVAPERRIEADPAIAGPALEGLRYLEPQNPLTELYISLLQKAIDKDKVESVHPAFANIIQELSADEAVILWNVYHVGHRVVRPRNSHLQEYLLDIAQLQRPLQVGVSIGHLTSLGVIKLDNMFFYSDYRTRLHGTPLPASLAEDQSDDIDIIYLTSFGADFAKACIPDDFCPRT